MKMMDFLFFLTILTLSHQAFVKSEETLDMPYEILQNLQEGATYGMMRNLNSATNITDVVDLKEDYQIFVRYLKNGVKSLLVDESEIGLQNVTAKCMNDTITMFQDLLNGAPYAVSMFDADGKPGSGIEHGNLIWLGNQQECKQAKSEKFNGQMCNILTNVKISGLMTFGFQGCFPDSCSNEDVGIMIFVAFQTVSSAVKSKTLIYPQVVDCPKPLEYSQGDHLAIAVSCILFAAVIIGTLTDIILQWLKSEVIAGQGRSENLPNYTSIGEPAASVNTNSERMGLLSNVPKSDVVFSQNTRFNTIFSQLKETLLAFSVISNTRKLLNTSTASGSLTSINGMRVISMWWVILGHTFAFNITSIDNIVEMLPIIKRFSFQCIINGTYSVDTFFFMSGLLVTYTVIKKLREHGRINWAMFYFHRFWRLTPVYAFALLIWTTLYRHLIWEGPYAVTVKQDAATSPIMLCEKYWWTNLLYINNFYPNYGDINKQCMGWGWYLANDMQFFIISPLFLIFLHRWKIVGHGLLLFGIMSCIVSRVVTADYYGILLPTTMDAPRKHANEPWATSSPLYNKPNTRIAPYLVGMWLGYILAINSNRIRLGKLKILLGWAVAIAIGMSVVYGLYHFYKDSTVGGKTESIFYIGLARFAWSVALAWVIFVCAVGHGGPVNTFLSWKVWALLGRLTYCAYLVHPAVIFFFTFNFEKPIHYTDSSFILLFVSLLVVSYCVAFLLSIFVEAPMLALEKVLFKRWMK